MFAELIPLALVVASSPLSIIPAVLVLHSPRPRPTGLAFLAGWILGLTALTAMLGHVFPVWLGFKGGKGVATALGVYLALCWPAALGALGVFLLIAVITRYISLASILGAAVLPVLFLLFRPERSPMVVGCVLFSALLVILKHHANISRLKSGTESKFGARKTEVNA